MNKLSMSVKDASDLLGVSRTTLYNEIKEGRIKTFRIAGRRLISRNALQDYLQEQERQSLSK